MNGATCLKQKTNSLKANTGWLTTELAELNETRNTLAGKSCNTSQPLTKEEIDAFEIKVSILSNKVDSMIRRLRKIRENEIDEMQDEIAALREMIREPPSKGGKRCSRARKPAPKKRN